MSGKQFYFGLIFASLFGGIVALAGFHILVDVEKDITSFDQVQPVKFTSNFDTASITVPEGLNFVYAAETTMPSVVHIRSTYNGSRSSTRNPLDDMFKDYFGDRFRDRGREQQRRGRSTGSGVLISDDGYIVTNNHVIDHADEIEILLNDNRSYPAKIVGTDPTTDLALLKIEESALPYLTFGNSDDVRIGEWVLAVGNPFEFRSTVTAGIVSQKARNINILRGADFSIEAFIQTDAAVNPGNSGGALVDLRGNVVGINTAIATHTGSFEGYSFAVPASLVKKVMDDLLEFGVVQRALLGVSIVSVTAELAEDKGLDILTGIYIMRVNAGSSADDAGIEEGDVIIEVGNVKVKNVAELQEQIARKRPGDKVLVKYIRDGREKTVNTTLKNTMGNTQIVEARNSVVVEGATFEDVTDDEKEKLDIDGGAKLIDTGDGKWKDAGIDEGFIVTNIDKKSIGNVQDLRNALLNKSGGTLIEGIYANGEEAFYGIGW